jgi:hypothetical protein
MEITTIKPFLHYFDRLRKRKLHVFEYVPPAKIEWRPAPGRFSFGDMLRHLSALERYMYVENAFGRPSQYPGHHQSLASGYDNVVSYAKNLHRETLEMLSNLSNEDLQKKNPNTGWNTDNRLEMAPNNDRARSPPSRAAISNAPRNRCRSAAALWSDFRRSSGSKY